MKTLTLRWTSLASGEVDDPHANGEYALLRVLGPHLRMVIDVGANTGAWTWKTQMVSQGSAHVLAIEPQRELADALKKRFADLSHIRVLNCALGAQEGVKVLKSYAGEYSGMSGLIQREEIKRPIDRAEPVAVMTLASLWDAGKPIDLLKIDVEGYEGEVLLGAYKLLLDRVIRFIQFEYGGTWANAKQNLGDIWAYLISLGYAVGTITPEGVVLGWGEEDYQYRNLFVWRAEEMCVLAEEAKLIPPQDFSKGPGVCCVCGKKFDLGPRKPTPCFLGPGRPCHWECEAAGRTQNIEFPIPEDGDCSRCGNADFWSTAGVGAGRCRKFGKSLDHWKQLYGCKALGRTSAS